MPVGFASIAALFGATLGSFINVIATRPNHLPLGRSHCPHCQRQLRWYELIPLVSCLLLQGRCRTCHTKISWQYPLVEIAMAGAAFAIATQTTLTPPGIFLSLLHLAIVALLVILFIIDLHTMLLPDRFVIILTTLVILSGGFSITGAAIGAGFLGLLWLLTRGRGIGLGDVKLMLPLGLLLGPSHTILLLFTAFTIGGLVSLILLASHKATMKTAVPFGPFLTGSAIMFIIFPSLPQLFIRLLIG